MGDALGTDGLALGEGDGLADGEVLGELCSSRCRRPLGAPGGVGLIVGLFVVGCAVGYGVGCGVGAALDGAGVGRGVSGTTRWHATMSSLLVIASRSAVEYAVAAAMPAIAATRFWPGLSRFMSRSCLSVTHPCRSRHRSSRWSFPSA